MRPLAGPFGETLNAIGTFAPAEAFSVVDRHLAPDPVGVRRRRVPVASAAGLGLLLGPAAHPQDLAADAAGGQFDQSSLVVRHAVPDPVQAGIVAPALQDGVRRLLPQDLARR